MFQCIGTISIGRQSVETHLMSGVMLVTWFGETGNSMRALAQLSVYISGDQECRGMSTRKFVRTTCARSQREGCTRAKF